MSRSLGGRFLAGVPLAVLDPEVDRLLVASSARCGGAAAPGKGSGLLWRQPGTAAADLVQLQTAGLLPGWIVHTGLLSPGTPRPGQLKGRSLRVTARAVVCLAWVVALIWPTYGTAHIGAGL